MILFEPTLSVRRLTIPLIAAGKVVNLLYVNRKSVTLVKFAMASGNTVNVLPVTCAREETGNPIAMKCVNYI